MNGPVAIRVYILSWNVLPRKKKYHTSSRKFGETELSQKATARYGTVAVYDLAVYTRLVVCSSRTPAEQTGICNDRCHAATRFSRRLIVPHHMDCPDNLECWWFNKATRLKRTYTASREKPNLHRDCAIGMALRSLGSGPQQQLRVLYMFHHGHTKERTWCIPEGPEPPISVLRTCSHAHANASYMHGCDCYINYVYSAYVVLLIDRCTPLYIHASTHHTVQGSMNVLNVAVTAQWAPDPLR